MYTAAPAGAALSSALGSTTSRTRPELLNIVYMRNLQGLTQNILTYLNID